MEVTAANTGLIFLGVPGLDQATGVNVRQCLRPGTSASNITQRHAHKGVGPNSCLVLVRTLSNQLGLISELDNSGNSVGLVVSRAGDPLGTEPDHVGAQGVSRPRGLFLDRA